MKIFHFFSNKYIKQHHHQKQQEEREREKAKHAAKPYFVIKILS